MNGASTGLTDHRLTELRNRLLELARRRVPEDSAEDLVQEALTIIAQKGIPDRLGRPETASTGPGDLPPLAWSFQVLRNVIGNYYQRRAALQRGVERLQAFEQGDNPTPLEALEERDALARIERGLRLLGDQDPACGRYLSQVAAGAAPNDLAQEEGLDPAVLYRRIYRCRAKLRAILEEGGVRV